MTALSAPALQVAAFGGIEEGLWGVAWGGSELVAIVAGMDSGGRVAQATLAGVEPDDEWRLEGDDVAIALAPQGEPVPTTTLDGFDQLCRVRGEVTLGGSPRAVDCAGRRMTRAAGQLAGLDSIRDFSAWFAHADGVSLTALRPADAEGHERDALAAALFEPAGAAAVEDPRFSTTYDTAGVPSGVSLELWLEDEESGEALPRRMAGRALGPAVSAQAGEQRLIARAFRCFAHGLQGLGVYVLTRAA